MHLPPVPGPSKNGVIFEDMNSPEKTQWDLPFHDLDKILCNSGLGKCRAAMVFVVSVFKEEDSTLLTLGVGLVEATSWHLSEADW